jgi:outer membrane protein TolC
MTMAALAGFTLEGASVIAGSRYDTLDTARDLLEGEAGVVGPAARLKDYLAYAARRNPALEASFYGWRAQVEKAGYAGALPDPTFSYSYFIENVETRVGPQEQRFGLAQSFPWFGTLGVIKDVALEAANAAYQQYQAEKARLLYRVKSAYYEYYYLGREIAITRENLELLKFWESVTRAKYQAALKQHHDLIKVQVELAALEERLRTLEDTVGPVTARLRAALNMPDSIHLPVPTKIYVEEVSVDRDAIVGQVLAQNPELKSLLHLVNQNKASQRLAGKMSMPRFTVGVDYVQTGEALFADVADSGKDPWMVKVGMSVPIWFGANKAKREESKARYNKAKYDRLEAQNQLRVMTEKIVFEHEEALRKTQLYRDGLLPMAKQSLNVSYAAYQSGETDFLNVLDAQRQLLDFQLKFERSASDLAISRAAIEMITGEGTVVTENE